ncbi:MAG: TetR family transcriptional regulator [Actinobacteria bacterium ATB1]|nr:TetR family transcriptional regulator [Actinobacteria bacterium ATB1]
MTHSVMIAPMARIKPGTRLAEIGEAAITVFSELGFRRTQVADVAREAGVSAGTIYNYVTGKDALFELAVECSFADEPVTAETGLPRDARGLETTLKQLARTLDMRAGFPLLHAASKHDRAEDIVDELTSLMEEMYDVFTRTRRAFELIESSARDLPDLSALFYKRRRRRLAVQWTEYLESRIAAGQVRPLPHPPTTARLVIEQTAWFARHRHRDADSAMIGESDARETVVDFTLNGLLARPGPG